MGSACKSMSSVPINYEWALFTFTKHDSETKSIIGKFQCVTHDASFNYRYSTGASNNTGVGSEAASTTHMKLTEPRNSPSMVNFFTLSDNVLEVLCLHKFRSYVLRGSVKESSTPNKFTITSYPTSILIFIMEGTPIIDKIDDVMIFKDPSHEKVVGISAISRGDADYHIQNWDITT